MNSIKKTLEIEDNEYCIDWVRIIEEFLKRHPGLNHLKSRKVIESFSCNIKWYTKGELKSKLNISTGLINSTFTQLKKIGVLKKRETSSRLSFYRLRRAIMEKIVISVKENKWLQKMKNNKN